MSIFSKGGDIIDLPEMQRRGFVKFPEKEEDIDEIDFTLKKEDNSGVTDFLGDADNGFQNTTRTQNSNILDELSSFASIGASNSVSENKEALEIKKEINADDLKWRIENTEYKLEQILERLIALEKK